MPEHAQDLKEHYGFGLGLATAQGREAKVLDVRKYAQHALVKGTYKMIFRHEYMSLVVLNQADPQLLTYHAGKDWYIPEAVEKKEVCHCGAQLDQGKLCCTFHSDNVHTLLESNAKSGITPDDLKRIM